MSRALLFDMSAGVSGDMALGGLFALGFSPDVINAQMRELGIAVSVRAEPVSMRGLQAVRVHVDCDETDPPHRGLRDFLQLLEGVPANPAVKQVCGNIFLRLAEVEAGVHGIPIDEVHFHEIGGLDTFVDVFGTALGLEHLEVEKCFSTPFPFGRGTIAMEHGVFPEPAPATLLLTRGFPSFRTGWEGEHCTPTGAAIVTGLARPVEPDWTAVLTAVGLGAGSLNPVDRVNVLRLCLYEETEAADAAFQICQIECNLDNATPEQVAHAVERLFAQGCLDAWQEPIVMKKGRAAVKLCALTTWELREIAMRIIAEETPSGGLRWHPVRRNVASKQTRKTGTSFGTVTEKKIDFPAWGLGRTHGEYESLRAAALEHGVPLRVVQKAADEAAGSSGGQG